MVTTASKFYYGLAIALLVTAVLYGYSTGGDGVGPLSLGYKGGVGDLLGHTMLMSAAAISLFLGVIKTSVRDADPEAQAEVLGADLPPAVLPVGSSYWPIVAAFAAGLTSIGLVLNNVFFVGGLILVGVVALEWTVQDWSDRATGDPATNRRIRNRVMIPFEVPIGGAAGIAFVVFGLSRVFLAVSHENAVWLALVAAALIFGIGTILSVRPSVRHDVVAGVLVIGAVAVLAAGVIGAIVGEREFHEEDETEFLEDEADKADEEQEEEQEQEDESGDESEAPDETPDDDEVQPDEDEDEGALAVLEEVAR